MPPRPIRPRKQREPGHYDPAMKWVRRVGRPGSAPRFQARPFFQAEDLGFGSVGQHVSLGYYGSRREAQRAAFDFVKAGGVRPPETLPQWVMAHPHGGYLAKVRIPGIEARSEAVFDTPEAAFAWAARVVVFNLGMFALRYLPQCRPDRDMWLPVLAEWCGTRRKRGRKCCRA